ncbi:hypothetical protein E4U60_003014 [Claviceps pazoutovae]|uniref:Uncharacterized protein n=1 Tax=Claviceps pazoutovae TaxID=1649127 RepID=A0A9P7MAE0_9HYPO|nr:hypothetical protein E4U60_003014 [Claviceps pazoutovae]
MDNGKEVVAKIPNLNAPRPPFTIASEVATMNFMCLKSMTGVQELRRLRWVLNSAEFILMEKVNGVELQQVWPRMEVEDRREVVKAVTTYQKSWAFVTFDKYGSLYFTEDFNGKNVPSLVYTNEKGQRVEDSRFVIGTSCDMFEYGRRAIDFDRGAWSSLEEYHATIGHRELARAQEPPYLPLGTIEQCLRFPALYSYEPTREEKIATSRSYLKLLKYVLPADRSLGFSHLWHEALHAGNILMDPNKILRMVTPLSEGARFAYCGFNESQSFRQAFHD